MSNLNEKLMNIQSELKAPKNQFNNFGKYSYRSTEDILEGLKPLLLKYKATLTVADEIVLIGERYYVKATATIADAEKVGEISTSAYAREDDNKKGMDLSQLTGSTSSYARKYALNGLFAIDDTKDSDHNNKGDDDKTPQKPVKQKADYVKIMFDKVKEKKFSNESLLKYIQNAYKKNKSSDLTIAEVKEVIAMLDELNK